MGVAGAIAAGSAVLSAGAQVGSAALASSGGGSLTPRTSSPSSQIDPSLQVSQFYNLLNQGVVDPQSLSAASPVSRLIAEMMASGDRAVDSRGHVVDQLNQMWNAYNKFKQENPGVPVPDTVFKVQGNNYLQEEVLQSLGYTGGIRGLFAEQEQFISQFAPILQKAYGVANANTNFRIDSSGRIQGLLGGLPDSSAAGIKSLQDQYKQSYLRDLNLSVGKQQQDLLSAANAGNFNPGTALGDLSVYKAGKTQDADLEALQRALALITGQQSAVGNELNLIQGSQNNIDQQAIQLANITMGAGPGSASYQPVQADQTAQYVSDAGVSLGNAITNAGLLSALGTKSPVNSAIPASSSTFAGMSPEQASSIFGAGF